MFWFALGFVAEGLGGHGVSVAYTTWVGIMNIIGAEVMLGN